MDIHRFYGTKPIMVAKQPDLRRNETERETGTNIARNILYIRLIELWISWTVSNMGLYFSDGPVS
jgi:hypothetical protein